MALFRRPIPRRAFLAAALGALYAMVLLVMLPMDVGLPLGAAWLLLSVGLLFLQPLAYHAYSTWAILWIVWRGVSYWRDPAIGVVAFFVIDLLLPLASLALLTTSGYLPAAQAAREADETA